MYVFELRTLRAESLKKLIENLQQILSETSITFDSTGVRIFEFDTHKMALVHVKLDAENFEYYECRREITIGIDMMNLSRLIKLINLHDTLTLYVDEGDLNHLGINIENSDKHARTTMRLNLLDLPNPTVEIPAVTFRCIKILQSSDFQKICRDFKVLSEQVEIKSMNDKLIFSCNTPYGTVSTIRIDEKASDETNSITQDNSKPTSGDETATDERTGQNESVEKEKEKEKEKEEEIVQGVFNLDKLVMFAKFTNLSMIVELYLKNDYPMIVKYNVANLGTIMLTLAPRADNI
jgi:proliferating cell nuclear antigen